MQSESDRGERSEEALDRRFKIRLAKKVLRVYDILGRPTDLRYLAEAAALQLFSLNAGDWSEYL